ncbi:hypothetical protein dsx2_1578 [Desulfovibrio sp. X2]|uniref:hypothetical protein n=1 Tax=Desulfovibrio sp. X2 TaxID=941449 RepID=UPI000358D5E6|nr:hypothetical protein [Desulfovibrio sp. X2]EPR44469.1 hypothetical protein dsx2_1578 [Desulfovibrio sp. X2]
MDRRKNNDTRPPRRHVFLVALGLLALCMLMAVPAWAQQSGYTPNPDTAKDRRDLQMGTGGPTGSPVIGTDPATGDDIMQTPPPGKFDNTDQQQQTPYVIEPIVPYPVQPVPPRPRPVPRPK